MFSDVGGLYGGVTSMENPAADSFLKGARPGPGVWLWRKPVGATSFSAVKAAQAALDATAGKAWPVCHAGALDPFAEGLLPVLIGPATKVFERLHALPKTYVATLVWGLETSTGDGGGDITQRGEASGLTLAAVEAVLQRFVGWADQVPPATSNKRVDGERAYRKAHRGEVVVLPPSRVYLHSARVLEHRGTESTVELVCRGGFYVRSLARDAGRALGVFGHVSALNRTAIGAWRTPASGSAQCLAADQTFPWWARVDVTDEQWGALKRGEAPGALVRQPATWACPPGWPEPMTTVQGFHRGRLVALLDEALKPELLFPRGLTNAEPAAESSSR